MNLALGAALGVAFGVLAARAAAIALRFICQMVVSPADELASRNRVRE